MAKKFGGFPWGIPAPCVRVTIKRANASRIVQVGRLNLRKMSWTFLDIHFAEETMVELGHVLLANLMRGSFKTINQMANCSRTVFLSSHFYYFVIRLRDCMVSYNVSYFLEW